MRPAAPTPGEPPRLAPARRRRRDWRPIALGGGIAAAALVAVGVLVAGGGGGGDDGGEGATSTPATAAVDASETPPVAAPPSSITAGEWTYNFKVVSNACGNDPQAGAEFEFRYFYDEIREPRDGFLGNGEPVKVSQIGGTFVANLVFSWPDFAFTYPIDGGNALLENTFVSADRGNAKLTESYTTAGGTCDIVLEDRIG
jgi:hypothetical protein